MKRTLMAVPLAVIALSTAACGSNSSYSSQDSSEQSTMAVFATEVATTTEVAVETSTEEIAVETAQNSVPTIPAWVESPSTVGVACGTTPEGATAQAAEATSCGFAGVMYEKGKQMTFTPKLGASGNSLYQTDKFTVVSPITQEEYTVYCYLGSSHHTMICMDPSDKSRRASFTLLSGSWPRYLITSEG